MLCYTAPTERCKKAASYTYETWECGTGRHVACSRLDNRLNLRIHHRFYTFSRFENVGQHAQFTCNYMGLTPIKWDTREKWNDMQYIIQKGPFMSMFVKPSMTHRSFQIGLTTRCTRPS